MKAGLCLASVLALAVPSAALACSSISTERAIRLSDAVMDGHITCDREADECVLRVETIYKMEGLTRLPPSRITIRAGYRDLEAMFAQDFFNMCSMPFAPEEEQFYGRFFMNRRDGGYHIWSYEQPEEGEDLSEIN